MARTSVNSHLNIKEQLGEDLWTLVEELHWSLVDVIPLTTLPSPIRQHASFRLRFADGRTLKGRRVDTSAQAERIEYLLQFVDYRHFPKVVSRRGSALLLEWIEGEPLTSTHCQPELLRRCGALHGLLHNIPVPNRMYRLARRRAQHWQARLEQNIHDLVVRSALSRQEGKEVLHLAVAHAPATPIIGLVHDDFCAENMVLHAPGHIYVIDNETLFVGPCDYDLARTWYRWPLNSHQREAYYEGYKQYRSTAEFLEHSLHWAVTVLGGAAALRLRTRKPRTSIPIRRLRELLRDVRSGTFFHSDRRIFDAGYTDQ